MGLLAWWEWLAASGQQASLVRRVKVTPRRNAGLYQKTGLASHSGLWASSEKGATPTNQTEEPDQSFDTALHCAEVLLSPSSPKMPGHYVATVLSSVPI